MGKRREREGISMPGNPNILSNSATPEMLSPVEGLPVFFNWAEKANPLGVKELVGVIGSLMPERGGEATEEGIREGLTNSNLDLGFNVISSWLTDVEAEGFRNINWAMRKGFLVGAAAKGIKLPAKEKVAGAEIQAVLKSFSATVKNAEVRGMGPVQIVGNLLRESVGSRLSANGSASLREALNKPLGGHFEWIRDALGISDAAGQPGFTERTAQPVRKEERADQAQAKPAEAVSPTEREFQRKKLRIRQYLTGEEGKDFLSRTWDQDKWEHVGEDGSVKQVLRPLTGALRNEKVCLRRNVSDEHTSPAVKLRAETRFLERVNNPHFVKVYAHAPLEAADGEGIGEYSRSQHWEIVDYVDGITVERGWSEVLTPAVKLKIILAACVCEYDATHSDPPVWLSDLRTDAFIVQPDGSIKMIDVQVHEDYISGDNSKSIVIARELAMLCLEIFPGKYRESHSSQAIDAVFNPTLQEIRRRTALPGEQFPSLEEILRGSQMPNDLKRELKVFFDSLKLQGLKSESVSESLLNRILPIAQRLEREESAAKAVEAARQIREEARKRVERQIAPPPEKNLLDEELRRIASKRVPGAWEIEYRQVMASPPARAAYEGSRSRLAALTVLRLQPEFQNGAIDKKELFQIIGFVQAAAGRYNLLLAGEEGLSTSAREFVNLAVDAALKERGKHMAAAA